MRAALVTAIFLGTLGVLFSGLFAAAGCSDAETPNAYYDAGGGPDTGNLGLRDQPCLEGRCLNPMFDVCVQQGSGATATLICREICDPTTTDPCGIRRRCRPLDNGSGACLAANLVDEPCPCDDNLACVNYTAPADPGDAGPDGGVVDAGEIVIRNTCKVECEIVDGGDTCEPDEGSCRLFIESQTDGVCI